MGLGRGCCWSQCWVDAACWGRKLRVCPGILAQQRTGPSWRSWCQKSLSKTLSCFQTPRPSSIMVSPALSCRGQTRASFPSQPVSPGWRGARGLFWEVVLSWHGCVPPSSASACRPGTESSMCCNFHCNSGASLAPCIGRNASTELPGLIFFFF